MKCVVDVNARLINWIRSSCSPLTKTAIAKLRNANFKSIFSCRDPANSFFSFSPPLMCIPFLVNRVIFVTSCDDALGGACPNGRSWLRADLSETNSQLAKKQSSGESLR